MPNLIQLVPGAVNQKRPELLYGHVSTTQPAPTTFSDPLFVVFPQWQSNYYFRIDGDDWFSAHGAALPQPGADVVILKDSTGTMRCVYWQGKHSPSMPAPFCNKLANYLLA